MHVVVIGGGASGIVSAITSKRCGCKVTILEQNEKIGKKILKTGNGRCNYFNEDFTINHFRSSNIDVLDKIINKQNIEKVLDFFDSIGIEPKIKNGCYYPFTNKAETVLNSLVNEIERLNINVKCNVNIKDVEYKDKFVIKLESEVIKADKVIIATGSIASTNLKTNFGYEILKKFNHTLVNPLPALVQLMGSETFFKDWAGIRSDVKLKILENDRIIGESSGEAMFTNYGISGICTFDLSGRIKRGIENKKNEYLIIDFLPYVDSFIDYMNSRNNKLSSKNLLELFEGMLNHKLVKILFNQTKININQNWNNLDNREKELINKIFKEFNLKIIDTKSYLEAQVCSGGIKLDEINYKTMESLKQKNLYIIGEVLDVDADCGGYNLGFAWISALLAGGDND